MHSIQERLNNLGIILPPPPAPAANYVPYVLSNNHIFISGQLPIVGGQLQYKGKLGLDVTIETGQAAARTCGMNILSILKEACHGDLEKVQHCIRIGGFVNCVPDFIDHPQVINGVSNLMIDVFADHGKHARAAIGCASLPLGACVEVDAIFHIR